ncbi:hypothetical protein ACFRI7_15110 [Streptomyces sp. NPDC056716]|uniref:hypothetical protein n=1 Tax=unclassified Streptomyces TaxID=2593676 RepID=UPI003676D71C
MEQRIGTSSQPLDAGVNPAHIPGLTQPAPAEPEDVVEEAEQTAADSTAAEGAAPEPPEPDAESGTESDADLESDADADAEEDEDEAADGHVFEAADRRARIVADAKGVRLSLDEERCEFTWDEIGAIESVAPRFGKRYTVTVHTPDRRWYPIEIEAKSKADHKEWDERLDAVLDAYFEDGTAESDEPEAAEEAIEPDAESDADAEADEPKAADEPKEPKAAKAAKAETGAADTDK